MAVMGKAKNKAEGREKVRRAISWGKESFLKKTLNN